MKIMHSRLFAEILRISLENYYKNKKKTTAVVDLRTANEIPHIFDDAMYWQIPSTDSRWSNSIWNIIFMKIKTLTLLCMHTWTMLTNLFEYNILDTMIYLTS